jgi:hypothetical protein
MQSNEIKGPPSTLCCHISSGLCINLCQCKLIKLRYEMVLDSSSGTFASAPQMRMHLVEGSAI